jgi:hypothetical protein
MTPEEMFDRATTSARQDRHALIRFLANISETQAHWTPPDGEWTIALGLEHIMLTETYFRTNMLNLLRQAEASQRWDNTPAQPAKMSLEALRRRDQGFVPAPAVLEPQGKGDFGDMRATLLVERDTSLQAIRPYRNRDLQRLVLSHPVYGDRNCYDLISYWGIHDYLHQEQMQRVTRQPHYPTA